MFKIVYTKVLSPESKLFEIEAPRIARKQKAGQFVIIRVHKRGERIPLTISSSDTRRGTITIIAQGIGKTTKLLNLLEAGDYIADVVGPLGRPSEVKCYGTVIIVGGGLGTAIAYPTAKAMKEAQNRVISIIGARTKELVILEDEMKLVSDNFYLMTDDGSKGEKGFVTVKLKEIIENGEKIDYILAIGPVLMMKAVADMTRNLSIKTVASLNSIMIDGTGMCGCCRVVVDGKIRFACVDGPEFDAHLHKRTMMYKREEELSLRLFKEDPQRVLQEIREECRLYSLAELAEV